MKIPHFLMLISTISLLACNGGNSAHAGAVQSEARYTVRGANIAQVRAAARFHGASLEQESLAYFSDTFVATMSETAASKLKEKFAGLSIEIDPQVEVMGKPVGDSGKGGGCSTVPAVQQTPWGILRVDAPAANAIARGAGITVCVVDTGIQKNHPDVTVIGGENFIVEKGTVDPANWDDKNGHGTHVAGTIAARDNTIGVVGVAPLATLFAARVLNARGSGYMSAVAAGIRSCVANGADVINMSLGSTSDSSLVSAAVAEAAGAGVILVAAAGNEATGVSYPAKYAQVNAISATNALDGFAYFSNYGPEIDFAAPGVQVFSTTKGSCYATYSGTSMASPHAAGVFALALSLGRTSIAFEWLSGLTSAQQGAGIVDALSSVQ